MLSGSRDEAWTGWCAYFLSGVIEQAKASTAKVRAILKLHDRLNEGLQGMLRSRYAVGVFVFQFRRAVFSTPEFVDSLGISRVTARKMFVVLHEENVVRQQVYASGRRAGLSVFPELLDGLGHG